MVKTQKAKDWNLFKKFRRELKILLNKKKFDHATKLNSLNITHPFTPIRNVLGTLSNPILTSMLPDSSTTVLPLPTWIFERQVNINTTSTGTPWYSSIIIKRSGGRCQFLDLSKAFVDTRTRKLLYCCIVRPQLVYGSEVWSYQN